MKKCVLGVAVLMASMGVFAQAGGAPVVQVNGSLSPTEPGARVLVEFVGSPKMTEALAQSFGKAGFAVVAERKQADVVFIVDGEFVAMRPKTRRTARVPVGEFFEKGGEVKTNSGRGPTLAIGANSVLTAATTAVVSAGNLFGIRDGFNSTVSGDPDGVCAPDCSGWAYQQKAEVRVKRVDRVSGENTVATATARTEDKDLKAAVLFDAGISTLTDALRLPLAGFTDRKSDE